MKSQLAIITLAHCTYIFSYSLKTQLGDEEANETRAASPPASTDSRSASAACIRKLYQKALALSDKKVKLAEETYALVTYALCCYFCCLYTALNGNSED